MVVVVGVRVVITVGFYSYYIASTSVKANSLIANMRVSTVNWVPYISGMPELSDDGDCYDNESCYAQRFIIRVSGHF